MADPSPAGEPARFIAFRAWLSNNGAYLHPSAHFAPTESGAKFVAKDHIPPDTAIVRCPFELAVTQELAKKALLSSGFDKDNVKHELESWYARQLICTYIMMHWVIEKNNSPPALVHHAYLATLPAPDRLRTPLHFTPDEIEAFKGTNLYGATLDRRVEWEREWGACREVVGKVEEALQETFTFDRYTAAATYLSSRAFPSSLLSPHPTLQPPPDQPSEPILLPGIDALNHARGQPVSWVVDYPQPKSSSSIPESSPTSPQPSPNSDPPNANLTPLAVSSPSSSSIPTISLVTHTPYAPSAELLNNYGLKPNSELILAYGFSLPHNPEDTMILKIGGSDRRWEVGLARPREGEDWGQDVLGMWNEILERVRATNEGRGDDDADEGEEENGASPEEWEIELMAADTLKAMLSVLAGRLPELPLKESDKIREEVRAMLNDYVEGQRNVLDSLFDFARTKESEALEKARAAGVDVDAEFELDEVDQEGRS